MRRRNKRSQAARRSFARSSKVVLCSSSPAEHDYLGSNPEHDPADPEDDPCEQGVHAVVERDAHLHHRARRIMPTLRSFRVWLWIFLFAGAERVVRELSLTAGHRLNKVASSGATSRCINSFGDSLHSSQCMNYDYEYNLL